MADSHFTEVHESETREGKMLDLLFTTNPTLVKSSVSVPGISDHDMVVTDVDLKPQHVRQKPRKYRQFARANWESLRTDLDKTSEEVNASYSAGRDVHTLWGHFKTSLISAVDKHVPTKVFRKHQ